MTGHRTYFDPPRTSSVRTTEWVKPKNGHRAFTCPVLVPVEKA